MLLLGAWHAMQGSTNILMKKFYSAKLIYATKKADRKYVTRKVQLGIADTAIHIDNP
jgi:hypothetical protein